MRLRLAVLARRVVTGFDKPNQIAGYRLGLTTDERLRLKELERENRELRQANDILHKASAYFAAAELGHWSKP